MSKNNQIIPGSFVQDIKTIIGQARTQAVRSVEFYRVQMYWKMGERIFNEEQLGKERADYGAFIDCKEVLKEKKDDNNKSYFFAGG